MRTFTRRTSTVAAAMAAATGLSIALASWTTNGTGTGAAASRTSLDLVVTPAVTTDTLFPTGSSDVGVKIANPNEYKVHVSQIVLAAGGITASDPLCNVAEVTYTMQDNSGAGWDIAGGADLTLDLADAVAMSNDANDNCKSNTFIVNLTALAQSAE